MNSLVSSSKAQMKIQQMAFVLVALMIFFGMVALLYFSIKIGSLKKEASSLQENEAREIVRKIASSPEFAFTQFDCPNCIDFDKLLALSSRVGYKEFWNLGFLQIKRIYPESKGECDKSNYPNCETITLINKGVGTPADAFISLCRWEQEKGGYFKCELGRILASGKGIK